MKLTKSKNKVSTTINVGKIEICQMTTGIGVSNENYADYIVKAVNSYEELKNALSNMLNLYIQSNKPSVRIILEAQELLKSCE